MCLRKGTADFGVPWLWGAKWSLRFQAAFGGISAECTLMTENREGAHGSLSWVYGTFDPRVRTRMEG
ncbi:MAG TPA: hypothetical protein DDZ37_03130 [Spirochaetaceae bacterium]|nr:hypothetical protein [Spirochaetaceae bacterium]